VPDAGVAGRSVAREQARSAQQREHLRTAEIPVLRREGVDRGRDHAQPRTVDPGRRERLAREDERVRRLDVPPDEAPGALRPLVAAVIPDVTPPDHNGAELDEGSDQARRLWVVDDDDVPRPDERPNTLEIPLGHAVEARMLRDPELAAVARPAVEAVVDTLRDREELGVALDHEPDGLEAGTERVADERAEHLGDPAAVRRRVDVHDAAAVEQAAERRSGLEQLLDPLGPEDRAEASDVDRLHGNPRREPGLHRGSLADRAAAGAGFDFPNLEDAGRPPAIHRLTACLHRRRPASLRVT
jgi:hypothetical protein